MNQKNKRIAQLVLGALMVFASWAFGYYYDCWYSVPGFLWWIVLLSGALLFGNALGKLTKGI